MMTSGAGDVTTGWANVQIVPVSGNTTPSGIAIFGFRQNNVLISEASVPVSPLVTSGRIYAESNGQVNTALAIANPNDQSATINFYFTDQSGANFGAGSTTIDPKKQSALFLNEDPINGQQPIDGTFTFTSNIPVAAVALRTLYNERSEFLFTILPISPLGTSGASTLWFPDFADGGGWTSEILLVNSTDDPITGTIAFFGQGNSTTAGQPTAVTIDGQAGNTFNYTIPGRSSHKFQTSGSGTDVTVGSVRVIPSSNNKAPSGLEVFSFHNGGATISLAGVAASQPGQAFRLYAEVSDPSNGSIQTGIAIANPSSVAVRAKLELTELNGDATALRGVLTIPGNGQVSLFFNQVPGLAALMTPFQGILRVSTDSAAGMSIVGVRGRNNERGDFLVTTTPPMDEAGAASTNSLVFPQFADGGGYTTQFVLFSGLANQSSTGAVQFSDKSGASFNLALDQTPASPPTTNVFPSPFTVAPGGTVAFSALVNGAASNAFNWSIAEGADGGAITASGNYTAPARMGLYHVNATSQTDPSNIVVGPVTVAENIQTAGVGLDFTQTRFSYTASGDAMNEGPMVVFKATNTGAGATNLGVSPQCNGFTTSMPIMQNPNLTLQPGESVFFKIVLWPNWCQGGGPGGLYGVGAGIYPTGSTLIQNLDLSVTIDQTLLGQETVVPVPLRIVVSGPPTEGGIPSGDVHFDVLLRDANGNAVVGAALIGTEFAWMRGFSDTAGKITFNVAREPGYWLWSDPEPYQATPMYIDVNNVKPQYILTLTPKSHWDVSAQLLATVKGRIGFWKSSTNKDGTKMLLENAMENWVDPSLVSQSKVVLLDTRSGAVLWSSILPNQSYSSDLSDDGRYAVVGITNTTTRPAVILFDATNGSVIWTKYLDTSEFPQICTSSAGYGSKGVKFSHDGNFIYMGLDVCQNSYLLNRLDGSIRWNIADAGNAREIIFSNDDRFIYIAPLTGWARRLNAADGSEVWRQFVGGFAFVDGFKISPDEKYLCTATKSGDVTLLTTADGTIIFQKIYGSWAGSCDFSPDSKFLFESAGESGLTVHDVATGRELWYRTALPNYGGFGPKRMSADDQWFLGTTNGDSGIYDPQGNIILTFSTRDVSVIDQGFVGWLSGDQQRYIWAAKDVNSPSGDVDVIQVFSIHVVPPSR